MYLRPGLLFGLGTFFVKVLSPWLRSIRYQGVDVSGTYTAELVNDPGGAKFSHHPDIDSKCLRVERNVSHAAQDAC